MEGPVRLDKTFYTDFKTREFPMAGSKISIVYFNHDIESIHTFFEYEGTVDRVIVEDGQAVEVRFRPGTLFYRFVSLGDTVIPLRPSTEYNLKFERYYTYMWANTGGSNVGNSINLTTPTKAPRIGGKLIQRKRTTKKRMGRSRRVVR